MTNQNILPKSLISRMLIFGFVLAFYACTNKEKETIRELNDQISKMQEESLREDTNTKIARDFFTEVFVELQINAIDKYISDDYIQHDPFIANGKEALIEEVRIWFEHMKPNQVDIIRTIAENDLVFVHTRNRSGKKVMSLMHVFRMEDNKIAEHWITVQEVPDTAKNSNTMF